MATIKIDITHKISPIGLLEYKNALNGLHSGDILEVTVQDPETVQQIKRIVKPSADRIIGINKEKGFFRLSIQKRDVRRS